MGIWEKIANIKIENPDRFKSIFKKTIKSVEKGAIELKNQETEIEDYYMVIETNRLNSYFIHIVPKEVYDLFKEVSIKAPQQFLGFSILVGKQNNKEIRLSCFGIPCNKLTDFLSSN